MIESIQSVSSLPRHKHIELELLHAILEDEAVYPWNPADSAATPYYRALETALEHDPLATETFESKWKHLSQQAESLWASQRLSLPELLIQRFESRLPTDLLTQIATKAQDLSNSSLTQMDQLVGCARSVLQDWNVDDLQVVARPFAMAMRNGHGEMVDLTLKSVRTSAWESLSAIEQARLCLAVARCALDYAEAEGPLADGL